MSVIRQPGIMGRTTRHRVVGVTVALTAALIETIAVGLWFGLVVGSRSTSTALAGLGILFCGSLLRTGVVGVAIDEPADLLRPHRLGAALALTAGWIVWLYVAEWIGGVPGVAIATLILVGVLTTQFVFERRVFELRSPVRPSVASVLSATLLAVGGAVLLVSVWFVDAAIVSPPISLEITTVVLRIEPVQLGAVVFGLLAFVAHQRRFRRLIET
ncbi:hypothetical protein [Natrarchaeobius oligotrophus]|uniref:Uncharacterized protein n=1 Tax=Natrarchaeobius chitinivorans TaxID=1679083 RepID=A0A3N6MAE2_NATCH|nr:hypothetical protein [Natrarchaeobius chitinivorans]RQH00709.1 hypothetical protein EA472_08645 [Natrarchaeobius chitinivorans]